MTSLAATSDAAIVELTSPTTTTRSGRSARQISSNAIITFAVCTAWLAGADAEVAIGRRQLELPEEPAGHRLVVVLAGIDQHLAQASVAPQRLHHRRDLHEVGSRANDMHEGLLAAHRQSSRPSTQDACQSTAFITVQS